MPLSREEVERIGAREGWRAKTFGRGMQGQKPFFHVIEFWIENRLMIEIAPPDMAREYQEFPEKRPHRGHERSRVGAADAGDAHQGAGLTASLREPARAISTGAPREIAARWQ